MISNLLTVKLLGIESEQIVNELNLSKVETVHKLNSSESKSDDEIPAGSMKLHSKFNDHLKSYGSLLLLLHNLFQTIGL